MAEVNDTGSGENTRLQKWVDPAMYAAEPVTTTSPRVYLLEATPDPLGSIAAAAALYEGGVRRSKAEVTHAERQKYLVELQKTKIKAPLEFVQFHFLIEGVTRGFTHQMVRQRTATFVQESTRFAVKEDVPVGRPPSIAGMTEEKQGMTYPDNQQGRWAGAWDATIESIQEAYQYLVNSGMPAEDARGLLPTNLLTRIHYSTDLRALLDHAGNRLCTQAQFEWRLVFAQMAQAIRQYNPFATFVKMYQGNSTWEDRQHMTWLGEQDRWQWEALADLFRPVCYQTGQCQFDASFDRKCSIRERVQKNAGVNRPSSEWHTSTPHGAIPAIRPEEWLTDPGAAR